MGKVNRYTRAGLYGKSIQCPVCNSDTQVYHFSWAAVQCWKCTTMVNKNEWNIKAKQLWRKKRNHP